MDNPDIRLPGESCAEVFSFSIGIVYRSILASRLTAATHKGHIRGETDSNLPTSRASKRP